MASEGLFSGCWTPATLRTFQVPLRASQLKVKAFYTRVGALADLKISKACRNIYRRIFSGGVIAWHGRNDLRDTTVVVHDKHGALVQNLTKDSFVLQVDDRPQTIRYFNVDKDLPLTLGLLVDTSMSHSDVIDEERAASSAFLDDMLTGTPDSNKAFVVQF